MAPALGRIYTPHDYGMLGAYMGIATVFGMIGNWQYGQAIIVQRTERRALGYVWVSVWASVASALLAVVVVVVGIAVFANGHSAFNEVLSWLWIVPITTFAIGVSGALASLANRRRDYAFMSKVSVISVIVSSALALAFGVLGVGAFGLVLSYVSGQLVPFAAYGLRYRATFGGARGFTVTRIPSMARGQFHFPMYSLPATVLRNLALSIPPLSLTYIGATDLAGHFSRAQSLLALPIGLTATALTQVFQERAVRERVQFGDCWHTYRRLLISLSIFVPPVFLLLAIVAPKLFVIYLGVRWENTGYVAQLLAPMMCLRMTASNKAFDYLACGLPMLTNRTAEWEDFFGAEGVSIGCNPSDPDDIALAVRSLRDAPEQRRKMAQTGRRLIETKWNYEAQFAKVVDFLESVHSGI
jgi:O-antigen/teichoic acid export membrane protein